MHGKLIASLLIAGLMLTSCQPASNKLTRSTILELNKTCVQAFDYKVAYLYVIKTDKEKARKIVDELLKAGEMTKILDEYKQPKLAEVFYSLSKAGEQFDLYLSTEENKYYTTGVLYYNTAQKLYESD